LRIKSTKTRSSGFNDSNNDADNKSKVPTAINNDRAMLDAVNKGRTTIMMLNHKPQKQQ
jgi:hypothetical protein